MVEIFLALFFLGIAIKAFAQVRKDPWFTPRVIALHVLAILLFFAYSGLGGYAVVNIPFGSILNGMHEDARIAILIVLFLLWLTIGLFLLVRYLNRLLRQEALTLDEKENL